MIAAEMITKLQALVGARNVSTQLEKLMIYSFDSTFRNHMPEAVVKPHTAAEAAAVVQMAAQYGIPVVARGAGTSLSGGPVPLSGGIVLEMTALNRILEINEIERYAVVEPGVVTAKLAQAADKQGLFYPPDPSSQGISTLGGNAAECAGGGRGVKYGVTKDYILELEVVLPNGDLITVGNKVDGLTGWLDWPMLFTGAEGTLGIITKMTVRLLPKPETIRTALVQYEDLQMAAKTVSAIIGAGIVPTTIEIMDQSTIAAVENFLQIGLDTSKEAFLLLEVDGTEEAAASDLKQMIEICRAHQAVEIQIAASEAERAALWKARRSISGACGKLNPTKIGEDIAVPPSAIPEMILAVKSIAEKYDLKMVVFGHAGDGNLHPNIMTDKKNQEEMKRVEQAIAELFASALALGGTLSGEHGIGFMKADYLLDELGEIGYRMQKHLKQAIDPQGILNPGKIFTETSVQEQPS